MSLLPIYSRRKRQAQPNAEDVYVYDQIPKKVRVQVVQILSEGLGKSYYVHSNYSKTAKIYDYLCKEMCRELGIHTLHFEQYRDNRVAFLGWLERHEEIDTWLDGLEMALQFIDGFVRSKLSDYEIMMSRGSQTMSLQN
jgi:AbiJ N-terminal domain 4